MARVFLSVILVVDFVPGVFCMQRARFGQVDRTATGYAAADSNCTTDCPLLHRKFGNTGTCSFLCKKSKKRAKKKKAKKKQKKIGKSTERNGKTENIKGWRVTIAFSIYRFTLSHRFPVQKGIIFARK